MKLRIFGFITISKNQFVFIQTVLFAFFFFLTIFFFSWSVPEYVDDSLVIFHGKYLKYLSLVISFLIVVETQHYLNKLIAKQLEINETQKKQIKLQNDEILESIHFASYIQNALLPLPSKLPSNLEYFIYNKPRNIVSGDFYWFTEKFEKTYIVASDCTGHGVPGAFMSVLGISSLNDIFLESKTELSTDQILNRLREKVISSLSQENQDGFAEAGMDLTIIKIDFRTMQVEFSGAKNPIFIVSEKEKLASVNSVTTIKGDKVLHQIKSDKMPIGIHLKMAPFTKKTMQLEHGDIIYMFSDGFADQMGGKLGKKLLIKRFKELLLNIQKYPLNTQKEIVDKFLTQWKGEIEQTDDILLMGIKF